MSARSAPIRVLIVDDHAMVATVLVSALGRQPDIEVVGQASTVAEGVALAAETAPDVVIMDYLLPDGDGAGATAKILEGHPDAKVLMLTGADDDRVLRAALDAGCCGFLTKQGAFSELIEAVRRAQAGDVLIPPAMLSRLLPRLRTGYKGVGAELTAREREVLAIMAEGPSNKEIAATLHLSLNTVRNHVSNILAKLDARSKLEAVSTAVREGLIDLG